MEEFKIFATTCMSAREIKRAREANYVLEVNYTIAMAAKIEAESEDEAIEKYQRTDEFLSFVDIVSPRREIHYFLIPPKGDYELIR